MNSGTIGQPDAESMSGGNYTLQGGFWGVVAAVQTVGAPQHSTLNHQHYLALALNRLWVAREPGIGPSGLERAAGT